MDGIPPGQLDVGGKGLLVCRSESGLCRVVCFSPRHDLTIAEMQTADIARVIGVWQQEYAALAARGDIQSVTIFENRGEIQGCSNPHPHGQIWANASIPTMMEKEYAACAEHLDAQGATLLGDYLEIELREEQRLILANDHFVVLVPWWATWPYETMILPRRQVSRLTDLTPAEADSLADAMRRLGVRCDNIFQTSFAYSMCVHQAPCDGQPHQEFTLHLHYFPPLLRSATVKKFLVGYELSAEPQRDITPEAAAETIRSMSDLHYRVARDAPGE